MTIEIGKRLQCISLLTGAISQLSNYSDEMARVATLEITKDVEKILGGPIPVVVTLHELNEGEKMLARHGYKIDAIKELRARLSVAGINCGLKEAKDLVEAYKF